MGNPILVTFIFIGATHWYVDSSVYGSGDGLTASTPFKTIAEATALQGAGDTIHLAAGLYLERVLLTGSFDTTLAGSTTGLSLIKDPSGGLYDGISVAAGRTRNTVIKDVAITEFFHGIRVTGASPLIKRVTVTDCGWAVFADYDASVDTQGSPRITNVFFANNGYGVSAGGANGPIPSGTLEIDSSVFSNNNRDVRISTSPVIIHDNIFEDATYESIQIDARSQAFAFDDRVSDNAISCYTTHLSSGIEAFGALDHSTITRNRIYDCEKGIELDADDSVVTNNHIMGGEYGIRLLGSTAQILHNTVVNNEKNIWATSTDKSRIVNNVMYGGDYGFYTGSTATTKLGSNDAYGAARANYSGTYVDLGGNFSTDPLLETDLLTPSLTSPLLENGAATNVQTDIRHGSRPLNFGPDIGAFECNREVPPNYTHCL